MKVLYKDHFDHNGSLKNFFIKVKNVELENRLLIRFFLIETKI